MSKSAQIKYHQAEKALRLIGNSKRVDCEEDEISPGNTGRRRRRQI
jgi:hypothetical protein